MKNRALLFIGILLIFFSCMNNESDFLENEKTPILLNRQNETPEIVASFSDSPDTEVTLLNEIIIKYKPGISEDAKEILRNDNGVISFRKCDCTNSSQIYELWIMRPDIDIEPTVKVLKRKTKDEVEFIAPNRGYNLPMYALSLESENTSNDVYIQSSFNEEYLNRIVASNTGITVAVLDTGIDTQQVGFTGDFLYNSSQNANCNEESGRDFINNDNNPYDDDPFLHGTVVSYIIHNQLNLRGVDHQILPVKMADQDGKSTYFATLCSLEYAKDKEADVINMSFGWESSDPNIYDLFSDLIDTIDAVIVTSAGNKNKDNDTNPHYPSNFPQDQVLAVASAKFNLNNAALYSNFGASTVDVYAIGNQIPFPLKTQNTFANFRGTSFAAPRVSARVAELLWNNFEDIRNELIQQYGTQVNYSKPVFYSRRVD